MTFSVRSLRCVVGSEVSMGTKCGLDEISRLCDNLQLDEEDGPVVRLGQGDHSKGLKKLDMCLVVEKV